MSGLKREELAALNSMMLHEVYFACLGGDGKLTEAMRNALTEGFGSADRWRSEFIAMGKALTGGSGWVLLVYVPRERRLVNHFAADHSQHLAGGVPLLALDMYEHASHSSFGASARSNS